MYKLTDKKAGDKIRISGTLIYGTIIEILTWEHAMIRFNDGNESICNCSDIDITIREHVANKVDGAIEAFQMFTHKLISGKYDQQLVAIAIGIIGLAIGITINISK